MKWSIRSHCLWWSTKICMEQPASSKGGGPRVVVSTATFHARVLCSFLRLGGLKKKNVSSPSTRKTKYCGEPPWARGSVLGLRPPGFESCVWRAVSSRHPEEVLLTQFSLYVHKSGLKPDSFHLHLRIFQLSEFAREKWNNRLSIKECIVLK